MLASIALLIVRYFDVKLGLVLNASLVPSASLFQLLSREVSGGPLDLRLDTLGGANVLNGLVKRT